MIKHKSSILFFGIFILGSIIRITSVEAVELWADEWHLLLYAMQDNLAGFFHDYYGKANNNVLLVYYLFSYFFFKIVSPDTEFIARAWPLFFGILSLPLAYMLISRIFDKEFGLIFTLLAALSFFHIRYSMEARPYSLITMLTIVFLYSLARIFEKQTLGQRYRLLLISALLYLCHPAAIVFIVPGYLIRLITFLKKTEMASEQEKGLFKRVFELHWIELIVFFALSTLLTKPFVTVVTKEGGFRWIEPPGIEQLTAFYRECLQFSAFEQNLAFIAVGVFLALGAALKPKHFWKSICQKWRAQRLLIVYCICISFLVPLSVFLVSLKWPMFVSRYLISVLFPLLLLLTLLIQSIYQPFKWAALIVILICGLISFSQSKVYERPDWQYARVFEYSERTSTTVGIYSYRSPAIVSFYQRKHQRKYPLVHAISDYVVRTDQFTDGDLIAIDQGQKLNLLKLPKGCQLIDTDRLMITQPAIKQLQCPRIDPRKE